MNMRLRTVRWAYYSRIWRCDRFCVRRQHCLQVCHGSTTRCRRSLLTNWHKSISTGNLIFKISIQCHLASEISYERFMIISRNFMNGHLVSAQNCTCVNNDLLSITTLSTAGKPQKYRPPLFFSDGRGQRTYARKFVLPEFVWQM